VLRKFVLASTLSGAIILGGATAALANNPPGTGQPSQSCENPATTTTPGNAASAPGSAFNPSGTAGTHYAGNAPQNSTNPKSVSQYDMACFQQSSH
jgi:hypothetical protein